MKSYALLISLASCLFLFGACSPAKNVSGSSPAPKVTVVHPQHSTIEHSITLPGDLVGFYQAALYAKVTGYLKSISVDKGDWVKAGQVLAVIEVPELAERLARSRASLEIERLTYQRLQSVWKSDPRLVARQDVDIAYAKFQEARANVEELQALESYTRIVAPFDGIVTERFVDPGALIHAGGSESATAPMQGAARPGGSAAPVVSIARLDKLRIYLYVPQREAALVHQDMPVKIRVQGFHGVDFTGQVVRFAHSLDLATRTMLTEIDLENPHNELYPGMYAKVTLVLERHPDALRLPATAIGGDEHPRVLVARDGELVEVPVTVGINDGSYVEITSGITSKDAVVRTFSTSLHEGERVLAESEIPDTALANSETEPRPLNTSARLKQPTSSNGAARL
jgi:membrane fusion protein (multidrug efflux system)